MMCPSCGKENGGRFGELCPACKTWMGTRRLPDVEPKEDSSGSTGVILGFVARNTRWLRKAQRFFDGLRW